MKTHQQIHHSWIGTYTVMGIIQDLGNGNLSGPPPQCHPPSRNKALVRPSYGKPMVHSPLIRPLFLGGTVALGGEVPLRLPWLDPGVFDARSPSLPIRRWRNAASAAGRTSLSQHLDMMDRCFFPVKLCFSQIDSWVFFRNPPKEGPEPILKSKWSWRASRYIYVYVIHICMVAAHLGLSKEPLGSCTVPKQGLPKTVYSEKSTGCLLHLLSHRFKWSNLQHVWRIPYFKRKKKHHFLIHQLVVWHAWIPNSNKLVVKSHTQAATIFPLNT